MHNHWFKDLSIWPFRITIIIEYYCAMFGWFHLKIKDKVREKWKLNNNSIFLLLLVLVKQQLDQQNYEYKRREGKDYLLVFFFIRILFK